MTNLNPLRKASRRLIAVLVAMVAIDVLFVVLHVALEGDSWSLGYDGGFAELYGYAKAAVVTVSLIAAYRRTRQVVLAAWALTFFSVLLDDSLQLHERIGGFLDQRLSLPSILGLRGQDLGEVAAWMLMAAVLLPIILLAHRGSNRAARQSSLLLGAMMAVLVVIGVGGDMLHVVLQGRGAVIAAIAEDGGELVMLSLIAFTCLAILTASRPPLLVSDQAIV